MRRDIAVAGYEKTIQTAFREVADALSAKHWLAEQLTIQRANLEAQSERARPAKLRYDNGSTAFLEVLDAQRDLLGPATTGTGQTRRACCPARWRCMPRSAAAPSPQPARHRVRPRLPLPPHQPVKARQTHDCLPSLKKNSWSLSLQRLLPRWPGGAGRGLPTAARAKDSSTAMAASKPPRSTWPQTSRPHRRHPWCVKAISSQPASHWPRCGWKRWKRSATRPGHASAG